MTTKTTKFTIGDRVTFRSSPVSDARMVGIVRKFDREGDARMAHVEVEGWNRPGHCSSVPVKRLSLASANLTPLEAWQGKR